MPLEIGWAGPGTGGSKSDTEELFELVRMAASGGFRPEDNPYFESTQFSNTLAEVERGVQKAEDVFQQTWAQPAYVAPQPTYVAPKPTYVAPTYPTVQPHTPTYTPEPITPFTPSGIERAEREFERSMAPSGFDLLPYVATQENIPGQAQFDLLGYVRQQADVGRPYVPSLPAPAIRPYTPPIPQREPELFDWVRAGRIAPYIHAQAEEAAPTEADIFDYARLGPLAAIAAWRPGEPIPQAERRAEVTFERPHAEETLRGLYPTEAPTPRDYVGLIPSEEYAAPQRTLGEQIQWELGQIPERAREVGEALGLVSERMAQIPGAVAGQVAPAVRDWWTEMSMPLDRGVTPRNVWDVATNVYKDVWGVPPVGWKEGLAGTQLPIPEVQLKGKRPFFDPYGTLGYETKAARALYELEALPQRAMWAAREAGRTFFEDRPLQLAQTMAAMAGGPGVHLPPGFGIPGDIGRELRERYAAELATPIEAPTTEQFRKWWAEGQIGATLIYSPVMDAFKEALTGVNRPLGTDIPVEVAGVPIWGDALRRGSVVSEPKATLIANLGERRAEALRLDIEQGMTYREAAYKHGELVPQLLFGYFVDPILLIPHAVVKTALFPAWAPYKAAFKTVGGVGKVVGKIPIVGTIVAQSKRSLWRKGTQEALDTLNEVLAPRQDIPPLQKFHSLLNGESSLLPFISDEGRESWAKILRTIGDMPEFAVKGDRINKATGFMTDEAAGVIENVLLQRFGRRIKPGDVNDWKQLRDFVERAYSRGLSRELELGEMTGLKNFFLNTSGFLIEQWLGTTGYLGRNLMDNVAMMIHLGNFSLRDLWPSMENIKRGDALFAAYGLGEASASAKAAFAGEVLRREPGKPMITGRVPWPFGGTESLNGVARFLTGKSLTEYWRRHPKVADFIDTYNFANARGKVLNFSQMAESSGRTVSQANRFRSLLSEDVRPGGANRLYEKARGIGVSEEVAGFLRDYVADPNRCKSTEDYLRMKDRFVKPELGVSVTDYTPLFPIESAHIENLYRWMGAAEDAGTLGGESLAKFTDELQDIVRREGTEIDAAFARKISEIMEESERFLVASRAPDMQRARLADLVNAGKIDVRRQREMLQALEDIAADYHQQGSRWAREALRSGNWDSYYRKTGKYISETFLPVQVDKWDDLYDAIGVKSPWTGALKDAAKKKMSATFLDFRLEQDKLRKAAGRILSTEQKDELYQAMSELWVQNYEPRMRAISFLGDVGDPEGLLVKAGPMPEVPVNSPIWNLKATLIDRETGRPVMEMDAVGPRPLPEDAGRIAELEGLIANADLRAASVQDAMLPTEWQVYFDRKIRFPYMREEDGIFEWRRYVDKHGNRVDLAEGDKYVTWAAEMGIPNIESWEDFREWAESYVRMRWDGHAANTELAGLGMEYDLLTGKDMYRRPDLIVDPTYALNVENLENMRLIQQGDTERLLEQVGEITGNARRIIDEGGVPIAQDKRVVLALSDLIDEEAKTWQNDLVRAQHQSLDDINDAFTDYAKTGNMGEISKWILPFYKWQFSRPEKWIKVLESHPKLGTAMQRAYATSEQEREERGLTKRFQGTFGFDVPGGGYLATDPMRSMLTVTPLLQEPFKWPGAEDLTGWRKGVYGAMRGLEQMGVSPGGWPTTEWALRRAGLYEGRPVRDIFPETKVIRLLTGYDVESAYKDLMAGGEPDNFIGQKRIERRLSEMAADGRISDEAAIRAIRDKSGELWEEARSAELDEMDLEGIASTVTPLSWKYATPGEVQIRKDILASKEAWKAVNLEQDPERKKELQEIAWAIADRPGYRAYKIAVWNEAWGGVSQEERASFVLRSGEFERLRDDIDEKYLEDIQTLVKSGASEREIKALEKVRGDALDPLFEEYDDIVKTWRVTLPGEASKIHGELIGTGKYDEAERFLETLAVTGTEYGVEKERMLWEPAVVGVTYDGFVRQRSKGDTPSEAMRRILRDEHYSAVAELVFAKDVSREVKHEAQMAFDNIAQKVIVERVLEIHPEWFGDEEKMRELSFYRMPSFEEIARAKKSPVEAMVSELWDAYYWHADGTARNPEEKSRAGEIITSEVLGKMSDKDHEWLEANKELLQQGLAGLWRLDDVVIQGFPEVAVEGVPRAVEGEPPELAATPQESYVKVAAGVVYDMARELFGEQMVKDYREMSGGWKHGAKYKTPPEFQSIANFYKKVRSALGLEYDEGVGGWALPKGVPAWFEHQMGREDIARQMGVPLVSKQLEGASPEFIEAMQAQIEKPAWWTETPVSSGGTASKTSGGKAKQKKVYKARAKTYKQKTKKYTKKVKAPKKYTKKAKAPEAPKPPMDWIDFQKVGGKFIEEELIGYWSGRSEISAEGMDYLKSVHGKKAVSIPFDTWLDGMKQQWEGKKYDWKEKDIEEFKGKLTWSDFKFRASPFIVMELDTFFAGEAMLSPEGWQYFVTLAAKYGGGLTAIEWLAALQRNWQKSMSYWGTEERIPTGAPGTDWAPESVQKAYRQAMS